jgi:DNA-directed RNA polymerase I, II, and III subunit RPABC5
MADKYRYYLQKVREQKDKKEGNRVEYLTKLNVGQKTVEGQILDDLNIRNVCCRRHFLTHVDIY